MKNDRHIASVGGGIAGLAAAHALIESGASVAVYESASRLGGVILTTPFAGHPAIDEGADAFLARVPWAVDLARKVSLGDSLTSPRRTMRATAGKVPAICGVGMSHSSPR